MGVSKDIELVGQRIAVRRMGEGLSQEKLAEMVGISKTAMGKIERGDSVLKTDTLISICRALHASPDDVMPDDLSPKEDLDPEMLRMAEKVGTLTPAQKKQFFQMMNVVLSGIKNPEK